MSKLSDSRSLSDSLGFFDRGLPVYLAMKFRAVARYENPGGHIILGGDNVAPLVEIGLTDLPKSGGGARAPPAPPLATGLVSNL